MSLKEMLPIPLFTFNEYATWLSFQSIFSIIYDLVVNTGCLLHFTAPHLCDIHFSAKL